MADAGNNGTVESRPQVSDPTGEPMMMAKFRAGLGPLPIVRRQRLLDRLSEGVRGPITLVTAPAGSGKTTLAGSWASMGLAPGALTWLSLDGDEQPGMFWSYVLEGLSRSGVSVSRVAAPSSVDTVDQSFLVRLSAVLYERRTPVVLALDDADMLAGGPVLNEIDFLLRHSGPQLRVVLITRAHPGPTLQRHRLAGSLTEIGLEDLAFAEDEARLLLGARGVVPSPDALTGLMRRTRGWATGLVLAADSARPQLDAAPAVFSLASNRAELTAYFSAEVLAAQPPGVRRFMLRTSIVSHLRPALADQLTGRRDADRMLATLARANAFLRTCSQHDDCYRYHPLFAEVLRQTIGYETPAAVVPLHRKAAAWWWATGSPAEGVRHAVEAGDWTSVATHVVDHFALVRLLVGPDEEGLTGLLAGMPTDPEGPETAVVLGALAIGRSDIRSCTEHLLTARQSIKSTGLAPPLALALTIGLLELLLARLRADLHGVVTAAATVDGVLDDVAADGTVTPAGTRALVLFSTGEALLAAGFTDQAATTLAECLRAASGPGCGHLRLRCLGSLALVEAVRGRLTRAAELASAANTLADDCGMELHCRPAGADVALAWVYAEACDSSAARVHAERAATIVGAGTGTGTGADPVLAGLTALVRSSLLRTSGDLDAALAVIARARLHCPPAGWLDHRLHAAAAAVQVLAGRPDAAMSSIRVEAGSGDADIVLELARAEVALGEVAKAAITTTDLLERSDLSVAVRVDAWLLRASCALERGQETQARAALGKALRLAEPERMRRAFAEAPPRLRRFLRHDGDAAARHGWLAGAANGASERGRGVQRARSAPKPAPTPVIVETLTDKEQEVLRHLANLLSTEEIATTMFVSVNTVKTHVRGILRKLAASRRNEAIRRARELGLL